uniref:helix-hairpin-helix domain-containing protein n=1 Tax=Acetatifactor sp. TaxID=1872090 RepID=UPI004056451A
MMRKKQYLKYAIVIVMCTFICGSMSGCGVRDAAMVIPLEETAAEIDRENQEADIGRNNLTDSAEISDTNVCGQEEQSLICVYICGAVVTPGVYEMPEGSRINDALQAAGGFAENAGKEQVNLAATVTDGQQIYFPTEEEAKEMVLASQEVTDGLVDINTADAALLMTLPGIGEARAEAIIAYREEHGAFKKTEDLQNVPGIKENMYKKLCDKIIVR